MWESVQALLFKKRTLLIIYITAAVIASLQLVLLGTHHLDMFAKTAMINPADISKFKWLEMTEYNNYVVFRQSYFHLIAGKNLYTIYPREQWDFFKYTPTFAILMGLLAYLPDVLGLSLWNILNALALFFAIRMLPFSLKKQCLILYFILLELLTSMQNAQSNGLMCGLMIAAYGCMQRNKIIWATLWLVLATYIKVYGAIGFCLFLFYPGKIKFMLYAVLWTIILALLPLLATSYHVLIWQYYNWAALMKADAAASNGISVSGWLYSWFGINGKMYLNIIGPFLFLLPLTRFRLYRDEAFRLLIVASMLIWVIIFNHKAESPTYIIAVTGVAIWYFTMPPTTWRKTLLWLTFLFTILGTTDIFPPYIRQHFLLPYTIKAVPCILVWCAVLIDIMRINSGKSLILAAH